MTVEAGADVDEVAKDVSVKAKRELRTRRLTACQLPRLGGTCHRYTIMSTRRGKERTSTRTAENSSSREHRLLCRGWLENLGAENSRSGKLDLGMFATFGS